MKKSELRYIIKEEINNILFEQKINNVKEVLDGWEEKANKFKNSIDNLKNAYYKKNGK